MELATKPQVLFVYYSYTNQTKKIVEAMGDVLGERGCDVHLGAIEFLDPRYAERFKTFPMPHPFREVLGMIPAEFLRRPGKIRIPDVVTDREYDLVCVGSPTWWLSTNFPNKRLPKNTQAELPRMTEDSASKLPGKEDRIVAIGQNRDAPLPVAPASRGSSSPRRGTP